LRCDAVFPGEIVDATIALGLDQDRNDMRRIEFAGLDQACEPAQIAGSRHGDAEGVGTVGHRLLAFDPEPQPYTKF
jgi:hypothetical protein